MTDAEKSIRDSLLTTLEFLASEDQQLDFASKIHYEAYQDEFTCWWLDDFFPNAPEAHSMFSGRELEALRAFSSILERSTQPLEGCRLSIEALQSTNQWKSVVAGAKDAVAKLRNAA